MCILVSKKTEQDISIIRLSNNTSDIKEYQWHTAWEKNCDPMCGMPGNFNSPLIETSVDESVPFLCEVHVQGPRYAVEKEPRDPLCGQPGREGAATELLH